MGKEEEDDVSLIREPLLNSSTTIKGKEEEDSCPYSTANLYSILTFSWLNPLLDLGNKKTINLDDVPELSRKDAAIGIYDIFKQKLFHTKTTGGGGDDEISSPKLLKALFWLTWREVLCTGLLSLLYISASFVGPYLIDFFVQYLNGNHPAAHLGFSGRELGYVLVSAFVLSKIVDSLSTRHLSFKLEVIGIRVKNALVAIIYDKLLTLSNQSRRDSSSGEIVNLMSVDADNKCRCCFICSALATVLVILVNISLGKLQGTLQGKLMESKDERMQATSETVRNMKILKLQGWEMKFLSKIVNLRKNEEGWLRKRFWKQTISNVSFHVSPIIVSGVTFSACMLTGIPLESGKVLSTIATVGILKDAIFDLPLLVSKFSKAKVSLYRVSSFLCQKDAQTKYIKELPSTSEVSIDIKNGSFSWCASETPTLKDVNLQVYNGMRVGVCGTECLLKFLKSKTVIYTTNQVEFLPSADLILVLKEGRITQSGTYEDILISGTGFMDLVGAHKKALLSHQKSEPQTGALSSNIISNFDDETYSAEDSMHEEVLDDDNQAQLVQEEDRQKGRVSAKVYWKYITAANKGVFVPVIILVQVTYQILQTRGDYWMALHTAVSKDVSHPIEASTLITYIVLASSSCFFVFLRVAIVGIVGYKTATILFKNMHSCIFRAPMSFLDATPSGRILDRASEDQEEIDCYTSVMLGAFVTNTTRLLAIIAVMGQGGWQIYLIYVPVAFLCIWFQQYSITATRELGRLKGVSNAPLKQHFIESISGLTTIKCFDQDSRFMDTNMKLVDSSSRPQFYSVGATEWLGFRLDVLSSFTFALALVFLISLPQGIINPAIAGLVVTYGLSLNGLQAKLIWLIGLIERDIISVERILQYSCIPSEAPLVVEEHRPASKWPSEGEVTVVNLKALDKCKLGDEVRKKERKLDSPVIIIAHRITSVLNSDAVLVLDKGRVVEYGSAKQLLENESSWFAKLVAEQVEASSA
ncbi:hypothetical protein MKW92_040135 [Papaver armeniacum]|nr:hypothetical protein MKW92_040135 [Papaver armeniacum]